jgi:hypothetical protein
MKIFAWVMVALFPLSAVAETCWQDDSGRIVKRRRPGYVEIECPKPGEAPAATAPAGAPGAAPGAAPQRPLYQAQRVRNPASPVPRPTMDDYVDSVPVPDRWRIVDALGYNDRWYDPYNRNILKADKPVHGDWFFNVSVLADTIVEVREVPTPVGGSSTGGAGAVDVFGGSDQTVLVENVATEFVYYKGDTTFRPPDWEFRFIPAFQVNHVELDEIQAVDVNPAVGDDRTRNHVGVQGLFVDRHLRNVSDRYDFDSIRVGIQPFSSDFRGFLFQDNQLGVRLFGTRDNNIYQYNLAWFRRLEKDTNSGLNDVSESIREDDVFVANLYVQDLFTKGFTSQVTLAYNRNREGDDFHYNTNGFIERPASIGGERPREYDIGYLGYSGDGHFGRLNLSASTYLAIGEQRPTVFRDEDADVLAWFGAAELSVDYDWLRPRLSFLYASGDEDPFDDEDNGFDAIFENPQFAGADTSYWIRQAVPLIGGGRVALSGRNGVLPSLRSSKEEGQSNFTNPGLILAGAGLDADVLPELRLSLNWNYLRFVDSTVLEVARNQGDIDEEIGHDVSISATYRPFMTQNIVVRASYATLIAGDGFDALYPDDDPGYFLFNLLLAF